MSPAGQPSLSGARKRPKAADFVDYSETVGPVKRLHVPQQPRVVIDVSDESDDGDMEMDIDSQQDGASTHRSNSPRQDRGRMIREFPPLTDTTKNKFSSSASSANSAAKNAELARKEKEIEKMYLPRLETWIRVTG